MNEKFEQSDSPEKIVSWSLINYIIFWKIYIIVKMLVYVTLKDAVHKNK